LQRTSPLLARPLGRRRLAGSLSRRSLLLT
jgi:hypothetical protein